MDPHPCSASATHPIVLPDILAPGFSSNGTTWFLVLLTVLAQYPGPGYIRKTLCWLQVVCSASGILFQFLPDILASSLRSNGTTWFLGLLKYPGPGYIRTSFSPAPPCLLCVSSMPPPASWAFRSEAYPAALRSLTLGLTSNCSNFNVSWVNDWSAWTNQPAQTFINLDVSGH